MIYNLKDKRKKEKAKQLPTLRFHLIPVNMAKINKTIYNKCWVVGIRGGGGG